LCQKLCQFHGGSLRITGILPVLPLRFDGQPTKGNRSRLTGYLLAEHYFGVPRIPGLEPDPKLLRNIAILHESLAGSGNIDFLLSCSGAAG